jgi:hypothetical protein
VYYSINSFAAATDDATDAVAVIAVLKGYLILI